MTSFTYLPCDANEIYTTFKSGEWDKDPAVCCWSILASALLSVLILSGLWGCTSASLTCWLVFILSDIWPLSTQGYGSAFSSLIALMPKCFQTWVSEIVFIINTHGFYGTFNHCSISPCENWGTIIWWCRIGGSRPAPWFLPQHTFILCSHFSAKYLIFLLWYILIHFCSSCIWLHWTIHWKGTCVASGGQTSSATSRHVPWVWPPPTGPSSPHTFRIWPPLWGRQIAPICQWLISGWVLIHVSLLSLGKFTTNSPMSHL